MRTPNHGAAGPAFDHRGNRSRTAQTRVVRYQQPVTRRLTARRGNR